MIEEDIVHTRVNFLLAWLIANAIGLGLGWPIGDLIGRQIAETAGWRIGQVIGVVILEGILWLARGSVLSRVKTVRILRPLDIIIWSLTEMFGWVLSEAPIEKDSLMAITGGTVIAACLGAGLWILLWCIRIPKPSTKYWALKAALWTFLGLVGGSAFIGVLAAISIQVGFEIAKMSVPVIGMALAGIVLGIFLGITTGLVMSSLIRWPAHRTLI